MNRLYKIIIVAVVVLVSHDAAFAKQFDVIDHYAVDTTLPKFPGGAKSNQTYAYITGLKTVKGTTSIDADYIEFLTGKKALAEAQKRGTAVPEKGKDGKMTFFVPNDYLIVNDNKEIKTLSISKNVKIDLSANEVAGIKVKNTVSGLKQVYQNNPFLLTLKGKQVTAIKQIFVP